MNFSKEQTDYLAEMFADQLIDVHGEQKYGLGATCMTLATYLEHHCEGFDLKDWIEKTTMPEHFNASPDQIAHEILKDKGKPSNIGAAQRKREGRPDIDDLGENWSIN